MNDKEKSLDTADDKHKKTGGRKGKKRMAPPTRGETLVKGLVMGFVISGVSHASRSLTNALVRHPLSLFSLGVVTGYMTHKYRKELIAVGTQTAVESKNFVLRQKENLGDFIAEIKEESDSHRNPL
ncbi:hypothetical protein [Methylomonas sp. LL1]|uniref:hypothetical protein n=1 Tax=Methylomonas sp. LL1 TaxID=2785785 RepID=UPI001E480485|nr:hypothetical protein [Methylomonas sp. LL1]